MDNHLSNIQQTRAQVASVGRKIFVLLIIGFALYCVAIAAVLFYIAFPPAGFSYVGSPSLPTLLPFLCASTASGLSILFLAQIFGEIGRGGSPFSPLRARQMQILGLLFLITVFVGLFVAPGTEVGVRSGDSTMTFFTGSSSIGSFNFDAHSFIAAIVCFVLSVIFKYGSTLECEADDLV